MERAFKLTKFRNLGLYEPERLVINHSLEPGKMGELIILIGPNNSGKSNVLDAMLEFQSGTLTNRDVTTLEYSSEYAKPEVSFIVKNGEDEIYGQKVGINHSEFFMDVKKDPIPYTEEDLKNAKDEFKQIADDHFNLLIADGCKSTVDELTVIYDKIKAAKNIKELEDLAKSVFDAPTMVKYRDECAQRKRSSWYSRKLKESIMNIGYDIERLKIYIKYKSRLERKCQDVFKAKYGIDLIPNIIEYSPKEIDEKDLACSPDDIKSNKFFNTLFNQKEIEQIKNAYATIKSHNSLDILDELTETFNNKIEVISKRFNKMYFAEKDKYKFSFKFLDNKIGFGIKRGNKTAILSYQSTGFKWFFNFYFNFLNNSAFKPGDIVIMDEPGSNLHPQGQVELRNFIKQLAQKLDITFIIATHVPFFIDVDNYDELRVVSIENNISHIANEFIAVNYEDPDTLKPIKESMTIRHHILYDYDTTVMFVEGITDYNYLTMFRNLLGFSKICFVPVKGLGPKGDHERVIKTLAKIGRNPALLVDGDGAGKEVQKYVQNNNINLEIQCISDILPDCKEIEDLFGAEDKIKHNVGNKSSFYSSFLKKTATLDDFGKTTKENFKRLLKHITI